MRFHILFLIVFICIYLFSSFISADRNSLFCKIRSVGLEYAKNLQPFRAASVWTEIADALNGAADTANCHVSPAAAGDNKNLNNNRESRVLSYPLPTPSSSSHIVFVTADPDTPFVADGTESRPFSSIESALEIIRSRRLTGEWKSTNHVHLILRKGIHRLSNTLTLTSDDSHLTLQSYPDEEAIISGAIELKKLEWKQLTPPIREEYESMNGYLHDGFDSAPPATLSLKDALAHCSSLELCRGISRASNEDVALTYFKYNVFWSPLSYNISYIKNVGYTPSAKQLFFVANVSEIDLKGSAIESLRVNGDRMIRARYPNVPRVELIGAMQLIANSWTAQSDAPKANYTFNPSYPLRNDSSGDWFQTFRIGVGGACADRFTPQASYWCSDNSQGGGPGPYEAPVGMVTQLPHSPYLFTKDIDRINIHTWRADRWFSWVFAVDKADYSNGKVTLSFSRSRGGNQGSRGGNAGQEFFIDNVLDELDQPAEFYHDTTSGLLYLWFNSTNPYESSVEAAIHQRIIQSTGTKQNPVRDINLLGLTFVDSAPTFLEPHGTPSGGDWGLSRTGALFFEGTENLNIQGCLFKNLDGNAVFLSGYTRGAKITRNEFFQIGETCIASWGYTDGSPVPGMGFDGTAGNQPRGSIISYNLIHEIGLWTKQNSAMFQSESFYNIYEGNIAYNGPRAGINFNDGMGGGSSVLRNVLFNFCRESSDHASFNSWNRQVYLVEDPITGKPTTAKQNDTIAYNWILANYQSSMAVDNDDGSAYYDTHHNVMISSSDGASYGGFSLKSDFGGHDNFHHDNLDLFWGRGFSIDAALPSHADGYYNNYLYLATDGPYGDAQDCYGSSYNGKTIVFNNTVWSPTGAIQECGMTLKQWQQLSPNNDPGTVGLPHPNDDVVIAIAKQILSL